MHDKFLEGFTKTSSLKGMADFFRSLGKGQAKITHGIDPEDLAKILSKVDELKPRLTPMHVMGASILAGMGAPIGAAIMKGTAKTTGQMLQGAPHPTRGHESVPRPQIGQNPTPFSM